MNYLDRHRAELNKKYPKFAQYKQNFNVTDDIMQELVTLAKDDKIEFNEEQYNRSKPLIMLQIKALIARDLYDMAEYFQVINDDNESFQEALRSSTTNSGTKKNWDGKPIIDNTSYICIHQRKERNTKDGHNDENDRTYFAGFGIAFH